MRNKIDRLTKNHLLSLFITHYSLLIVLFLFPFFFFLSCGSLQTQEEKLTVPRSTKEIRLDDIQEQVSQNPIKAIDLIWTYREVYNIAADGGEADELALLEKEAADSLQNLLAQAIAEQRWDDAASFSRSLTCLQIEYASEGPTDEAGFLLAGAKKKLEDGSNLAAFLAAVQVHQLRPLSFNDAMLFLERAVEIKQRRAAAYFIAAAEHANKSGNIPARLREYAQGSDSVADMIQGVATVIVDRGIRIERGRGYADKFLGSAFFIDSSGLLITNYHVIESEVNPKYEGYSRMYIRMGDSASPRFPARVIGWDKALDLALIKTEHTSEYNFSVVDWVIPQVGETIFAIGSPGGLEKTVTAGIVSSLSRRFLQIGDVYQIDAAVNFGNSGGPVVDASGRLVGIVFAGIPQYQGLNFAVPAHRLAAALPAMMQGGKAERPWLGISLNETIAGAEIIYTAPNTPASQHRIPEGSVIKSLNGSEIKAPQSLLIPAMQDAIFQFRPGELVALETQNPGGAIQRRLLMTIPRPEIPLANAAKIDTKERLVAPLFGMILAPGEGRVWSSTYLVKKIIRGSIADEAGISDQDPVSIRNFRIYENEGYAVMELDVKKRSMGYMETTMQLPALLDSPDTL